MREAAAPGDPPLLQELNDLLRFDLDAEEAYRAALAAVADEAHRGLLAACREDHRRHAADLARLIRRLGGRPAGRSHFRPGAFTWGVRAVAGLGGDREILSVLRANEERGRDAYRRRAAGPWPAEVRGLLRRHAEDEARHLDGVEGLLHETPLAGGTAPWSDVPEPAPRRAIA